MTQIEEREDSSSTTPPLGLGLEKHSIIEDIFWNLNLIRPGIDPEERLRIMLEIGRLVYLDTTRYLHSTPPIMLGWRDELEKIKRALRQINPLTDENEAWHLIGEIQAYTSMALMALNREKPKPPKEPPKSSIKNSTLSLEDLDL